MQNFVIRLKTGLHQATLTLAEPLQGPQVDMLICFEISWKNMNSLRNKSKKSSLKQQFLTISFAPRTFSWSC